MSGKKVRYVILPNDNIFNEKMVTSSFSVFRDMHKRLVDARPRRARTASSVAGGLVTASAPGPRYMDSEAGKIELLDSIDLNEATLARMTPAQAAKFAHAYPGLRVSRELILYQLRMSPARMQLSPAKLPAAGAMKMLSVRCFDAVTGGPVSAADIVVVLSRKQGKGIKDVQTNMGGQFITPLPAGQTRIDAVICAPLAGYWPAQVEGVAVSAAGQTTVEMALTPIARDHRDALDIAISAAEPEDGKGVKIAIIDAGTSRAPGLNIVKGMNTTGTEQADNWTDNGSGHGSHVAGIVARVAPAAELFIYRVFEQGAPGASEFAIARAVRQAVEDGCDLVNMSLGQDSEPVAISRETRRARAFGVVCVAATGNDYMSPVSYPARSGVMVAVSAGGVLDSWPQGAMNGAYVATKPKPVGASFFATFSNIGPEVDFIGPGVGIISWVTDVERGAMDGTSMACPAVTGLLARLLSRDPGLLAANRDQQRSDDIIKKTYAHARPIGFGSVYEGSGLIAVP